MKPFQKALFSGVSALLVSLSVAHAQEALGTINIVQLAVQKKTVPAQPVENITLGGQVTDRLDFTVDRINSRTVIQQLATTEGSGFPANTPVAGWNVVEVFDDAGAQVGTGFFAYKPGFAPILLTDDFFSLVIPANADSFESFITVTSNGDTPIVTKDNHYLTADISGTVVSSNGDSTAFTGVAQSTQSIRNVGPRLNPLVHSAVVRKGTIAGNTADYSLNGSFTSIGNGALVSVQAFEDAADVTPPAATSK